MHTIISLFFTLLLFTSCGPRYGDFFLYHDDGTMKPKVVLLPIQASSEVNAEKIAYMQGLIIDHVRSQGELFLYSQEEVQQGLVRASNQKNIDELAVCFKPADFVVESVLIDDSVVFAEDLAIPYIRENPKEHLVRLRMKILDIRSGAPKVVLFEVLEQRECIQNRSTGRAFVSTIYEWLAESAAARMEEVVIWRTLSN